MADSRRRCQAVVFDMDGLMIDSEPLWHVAERECFAGVGVELTHEDMLETTGLRIDEVVGHNFSKFGGWDEEAAEDGRDRSRAGVTQAIVDRMCVLLKERGESIKKPGLDAAISFFKSKGIPLAVASSSPMVLIRAGLTGLGLLDNDTFQVVVSAETEKLGKPYPGVYLSAASALGVDPKRCLALEDSVNGTLAARSASMKCISIPEDFENRSLAFHIANAQLRSLEDVGEDVWNDIWNGN